MLKKVTVIPEDGMISLNGEVLFMDIDSPIDMRALQWKDSTGHLEFEDKPNEIFGVVDYAHYVQPFVEMFQAEQTRRKYEAEHPSLDELLKQFIVAIQNHLDEFARTKTYDNMLSACTYASSSNPVFAKDGQYCVIARDATWESANSLMQQVMQSNGSEKLPTWEDVKAILPELAWPE